MIHTQPLLQVAFNLHPSLIIRVLQLPHRRVLHLFPHRMFNAMLDLINAFRAEFFLELPVHIKDFYA